MTVTTGGFQMRGKCRSRGWTLRNLHVTSCDGAWSAWIAARSVRSDRVVCWENREVREDVTDGLKRPSTQFAGIATM